MSRESLPSLLAQVDDARRAESALVHVKPRAVNAAALGEARRATLAALLTYAAAIEELGWPVPRSILMEVRMHRILCDPRQSHPTGYRR